MILIACLMMMALHAAKLCRPHSNVRSVLRCRYDHQLLSTEAPSLPQSEDVAKYAGKLGFDTVTYINRNRFWSKTVTVDISKYQSSDSGFMETNSTMSVNIINGIINGYLNPTKGSREDVFQAPETGMVLVPKLNLLIPIIDSQLQLQHALKMTSDAAAYGVIDLVKNTDADATGSNSTNPLSLIFCGFSNRAQQVNIAPCEEERPIDDARLESLDRALSAMTDVTGAQLMSAAFAGTSPARIYRSFVAPRPKAMRILGSIDRAANRTATQIMVSMRQVRADQASYLRNTDRSSYYTSLANPNLEAPTAAIEDEATVALRVPVLHPIAIVLDNVRSAFNVGSIFRSAETAGAAEVVTCGITAHPPHQKLRKTALSAVELVATRHFEDTLAAIEALRKEGYSIAVMETTSLSVSHTRAVYPKQLALVAGNEVTGVDPRIIEAADLVVQIPTFGVKNSLNVASAVPIVLFEVLRQWYD